MLKLFYSSSEKAQYPFLFKEREVFYDSIIIEEILDGEKL